MSNSELNNGAPPNNNQVPTGAPPPWPILPVPTETLLKMPPEMLMNIVKELSPDELLRLSMAYPLIFLGGEGQLNVVRTDARRIKNGQLRPDEMTMLNVAIVNNYPLVKIKHILDVYDRVFDGKGADAVTESEEKNECAMSAAIRVSRPEVVNLLLERGADIRVCADDEISESAFDKARRVYKERSEASGSVWAISSVMANQAREVFVTITAEQLRVSEQPANELWFISNCQFNLPSSEGAFYVPYFRRLLEFVAMELRVGHPVYDIVAEAMPRMLVQVASHHWAQALVGEFAAGSLFEMTRLAEIGHTNNAIKYLIAEHNVPVNAELVMDVALTNPRGANAILDCVFRAKVNNDLFDEFLDKIFREFPEQTEFWHCSAERYVQESFLPFVRDEHRRLGAQMLYKAVRDKNEWAVNLMTQEPFTPPRQALVRAVINGDMRTYVKLRQMKESSGFPDFFYTLPGQKYEDFVDLLAENNFSFIDVAFMFQNYEMLRFLLRDGEREMRDYTETALRRMMDALLSSPSLDQWEEAKNAEEDEIPESLRPEIQPADANELIGVARLMYPSDNGLISNLEALLRR